MYEANQAGRAVRITTAGVTVIGSSNGNILGVICTPSVTGATTIQLFAGLTATATAAVGSGGKILTGVVTFVSATATALSLARYLDIPAYCSGGALINIAGDANPDITLFWNPA